MSPPTGPERIFTDSLDHDFRLILEFSAGLSSTHCSKTAKYVVKERRGIIGSVNMFLIIL